MDLDLEYLELSLLVAPPAPFEEIVYYSVKGVGGSAEMVSHLVVLDARSVYSCTLT